jgi:hypothetical protein
MSTRRGTITEVNRNDPETGTTIGHDCLVVFEGRVYRLPTFQLRQFLASNAERFDDPAPCDAPDPVPAPAPEHPEQDVTPADLGFRRLVVTVDFDGIISREMYPYVGNPDIVVIACLKKIREKGGLLVLNTCRRGDALDAALEYCALFGLSFDEVNANIKGLIDRWGDCRKIGGDIYIDDRDICFGRFRMKSRLILLALLFGPLSRRYMCRV